MSRRPPAKLVEHVVAACGLSLTAREVAEDLDFDGEDGEIIQYQLECAGLEFARVVRLLHGWDALDDGAMAARAGKVFARCGKPDLHEDADGWARFGRRVGSLGPRRLEICRALSALADC